jgi:hypothetical protein
MMKRMTIGAAIVLFDGFGVIANIHQVDSLLKSEVPLSSEFSSLLSAILIEEGVVMIIGVMVFLWGYLAYRQAKRKQLR